VSDFFSNDSFMPHGMCYQWQADILWTSAASDVITAIAYFSFTLAMASFVKRRKDLPYPWFVLLAGSIIFLACGFSHLFSALVIWNPVYGMAATMKAITATSSAVTGVLIWFMVPLFLKIPSPTMLAAKNESLKYEVERRRKVEKNIKQLNLDLAVSRDKAEASSRAKSHFLSTMSHELRTPLNSIIGFTSMVASGLAGAINDEQKKQLGMVSQSSKHLLALINDVLDLSKVEAGELKVTHQTFDLRAALKLAFRETAPLGEKKGLTVTLQIDEQLDTLVSDPLRLSQVVINMLNNAIKFTHAGSVSVSAEITADHRGADQLSIAVTDTGIGIAAKDLEGVFIPFQQVDTRSTQREYEGTGLGLPISLSLAHQLGGNLTVTSDVGKGSCFTLTLPLTLPLTEEQGAEL